MDIVAGDTLILKCLGLCVVEKILLSGAALVVDYQGLPWVVASDELNDAQKHVELF